MDVMEVNIISPDNEVFSGKAHMVVIPAEEGYFAAMLDHAPTVTYLKPGKIEVFADDKIEQGPIFFVGGGFVKVTSKKCLIMVDYIKKINEINIKENQEKIEHLKNKAESETNDLEKINIINKINILESEIGITKDN